MVIRLSLNALLVVGRDWIRGPGAWSLVLHWNYAPSFGVQVKEGDRWFLNTVGVVFDRPRRGGFAIYVVR